MAFQTAATEKSTQGGRNRKHHLSHTDSVRLRLLLEIRFSQFGGLPLTPTSAATHKNDKAKHLKLDCSGYWPVVGLIYFSFLGAPWKKLSGLSCMHSIETCFEPLMRRASAKVCPATSKRSLMQMETASKSDLSQAWPRKCAQGWKWSAST